MQIFTSCLNTRLCFSSLYSPCFHCPLMMYVILCATERVQSSACGSEVRQDGSSQSPPTEESCTRRCWKGEMSLNKKRSHKLKGAHLNLNRHLRVFSHVLLLENMSCLSREEPGSEMTLRIRHEMMLLHRAEKNEGSKGIKLSTS